MRKCALLACAIVAAGGATGAFAQDDRGWTIAAEVGALATSGNTESVSVQSKIDATQDLRRFNNQYIASVLFKDDQHTLEDGTQETERTAEKYFVSAKSAYKLDAENTNLFVFGSHTDDKFGAYREYTTVAVGYGARLLDRERGRLDVEIGPGYFRGKRDLGDGVHEIEDGAMVRMAARFDWELTDTTEFQQRLSVEAADDNTRTISDSSVSVRIYNALQMKVGFRLQSDSDVPPDKEKTDTMTYVNLVYRY